MNYTEFKALFSNETEYMKMFLKVFLVSSIVLESKYRKLEQWVIAFVSSFYLFNVCLFVANIYKTEVAIHRIEIMMPMVTAAYILIILWTTRKQRSGVRNFISIVNQLEQNDKHIIVNVTQTFKKLLAISFVVCMFIMITITILPFVMVIFIGLDSRPLQPTVFFYSCENLISVFCIPSDTYSKYFFNNFFNWVFVTPQIILGFMFLIFYFLCYIFWTCYSQQIFSRMRFLPTTVKILIDRKQLEVEQKAKRAKFIRRRLILASWNYEREYDALFYSEFIEAIKQYQCFLRSFKTLTPLVSAYLNTVMMEVFIIAILTTYTALVSNSFMIRLQNVSISVGVLIVFYFLCYYSEIISHVNEEICYIIYEQEWYKRSKKVRKLYFMFLLHVQHPTKIPFFKLRTMNLNFFMCVLRHMYSILNAMWLNFKY